MKSWVKMAGLSAALSLVLSGCHGEPHSWLGLGGAKATVTSPDEHNEHAASADHMNMNMNSSSVTAKESPAAVVNVDLLGAKGTSIGKATLTQVNGGVQFDVDAMNLPEGTHGIHVHENGKCVGPNFDSAGAHFNPAHKKHGVENPEGPHAGDLPNLVAGADGKAKFSFVSKMVTLEKNQPNSLLKEGGTSLVIHEKADDYKTDPSGNSGSRIACGVIQ
ncbi:superoxide dismutase family protein [Paenibacillus cremeus]|uniref:Superoxide dismutase [Cu-Zn] n=1 Tax=Paenibacillus cremeus TaxID=2163881 RepID=A0A559KD80_9BACL|nr:superoxide dismutase family protein [Paenibacillus cremeus]TVY10068.1 superoxide dismutase family protein [Paenibacillus cremeus]